MLLFAILNSIQDTPDGISLVCQFVDSPETENVPHEQVARDYKNQLIEYYSSRVKFVGRSTPKADSEKKH